MTLYGNLVLHDPVGEKWERKKKVGSIPLLPSRAPSNHPCGLCLIYQCFHTKIKKKKKDILSLKDKGLTNTYKVLISTQSLATNPLLLCLLCIKKYQISISCSVYICGTAIRNLFQKKKKKNLYYSLFRFFHT